MSAKAVYLSDATGQPLSSYPQFSVAAVIQVVTDAQAADTTLWAYRLDPTATKDVVIDRIEALLSENNGNGTTTQQGFYIVRISAANASGGVAVVPAKHDSGSAPASTNDCRVLSTGLTVAGITFETAKLCTFAGNPSSTSNRTFIRLDRGDHPIVLHPGEGIAIRQLAAATTGTNFQLVANILYHEVPR